ncbi:hypothetical protein AUJ14_01060 [Candidatus Micrarchaeota archaeon CG1_02_55_22]|nr:MAG: hypothetical protein AUJ14_01060 [Candidatus Micrarchaeota archaeon CG1_02_55_22]
MDKNESIIERKELEVKLKQEKQSEAAVEAKTEAAEAKKESKAEKPAAKKEEKPAKKEEKKKFVLERVATLSLIDAHAKPRTKKGRVAMRLLRAHAARNAKATKVIILPEVSHAVVGQAHNRPAKTIKVLLQKDGDGVLTVSLPKAN